MIDHRWQARAFAQIEIISLEPALRRADKVRRHDEKPVGAGLSFTADRLTLDYGASFYSDDRMGHRLTVRWR